MKKDKNHDSPKELSDYSFEEAMRQIVNVQKIDVTAEIQKVKKKPRGKNSAID